jgi:hypothetical protein
MLIVALFTTVKVQNQHKCLATDKWMQKKRYIYIYNE